jgi:hypothetical protein
MYIKLIAAIEFSFAQIACELVHTGGLKFIKVRLSHEKIYSL